MRFEPKITQKLTLGSMAFSDGWQNYWQSEPSYRPHSENMICANSEREKRDISCRAWENEMCTLKKLNTIPPPENLSNLFGPM